MTTIYLAADDGLSIIRKRSTGWRAQVELIGRETYCLAADPFDPARVYCGTFGDGLWRSSDSGKSWEPVGDGIAYREVMSVAVSRLERSGDHGVVWAGTEPSALFRSVDGGDSWIERANLRTLPSAPTWSFPPRPWTHHVRTIAPDSTAPERLFVGIELGGVMRSLDYGETWEDYKSPQRDAHHLTTHPLAAGRVYETAGGGYTESRDGGQTWWPYDEGRRHHYLWGLAVDPADPDTVVISAARGPQSAHEPRSADSTIYRKSGSEGWQESSTGLPPSKGTRVYSLATNEAEPAVFYAANTDDVYRSADAGKSWQPLHVHWPEGYQPPHINAIIVVEN